MCLFVHDLVEGATRCLTLPEGGEDGNVSYVLEHLMSEDGSSVVFTCDGGRLARQEPEVPTTAYFWNFGDGLATRLGAPGTPLAGFQPVGTHNVTMNASGNSIVSRLPECLLHRWHPLKGDFSFTRPMDERFVCSRKD